MNIYVGNLPYSMNEQDLRALFAQYGNVDSVKIVFDRFTGSSKGFAFVEMKNDAEASQAINQVNGKEVGGRALRVNEARPQERTEREPREGGHHRGGGYGSRDNSRGYAPRNNNRY